MKPTQQDILHNFDNLWRHVLPVATGGDQCDECSATIPHGRNRYNSTKRHTGCFGHVEWSVRWLCQDCRIEDKGAAEKVDIVCAEFAPLMRREWYGFARSCGYFL